LDATTNEWVIALVAGVLAALVAEGLIRLGIWLREMWVGRGEPSIAGRWDGFNSDSQTGEPTAVWTIKGAGVNVRGEIQIFQNRKGEASERRVRFRGRWQEEQFVCYFYDLHTKYRVGVVALRRHGSAKPTVLAGQTMYRNFTSPDSKSVTSVESFPYSLRQAR
jgi:hypothetical protein